jgi:hypothetical protein
MTVAVGIEIGMSGRSEPGQNQALTRGATKTQGTAWGGAVATNAASTSASGAGSFRSGLQSLLASLNADGNGLIQAEPAANGTQAQADSALTGSLGKGTQPASLPGEDSAPSLIAAKTQPGNSTATATQLPLSSTRAAIPAWLTTSTPAPQIAVDSRAKVSTIDPSASTVPSNRATSSEHDPKQKAASTTGRIPVASTTAGNVPQAIVPVQSTSSPIEIAAVAVPSLPPADLAAASPATSQLDSSNQHTQPAADRDATSGSISQAVIQTSGAASGIGAAHALQPSGSDDRVESTTEAHTSNTATGSLNESSLASGDLHPSAEEATDAVGPTEAAGTQSAELSPAHPASFHALSETAAADGGSASVVATGTREVSPVLPVASVESAQVTDKADSHTGDAAQSATAQSFNSSSRSSTAGPSLTSSSKVAIGSGITAPLVGTSLNPSTSPTAPVRASKASEPLAPANLVTSTGTQPATASDAAQSSSTMPSQAEGSPETSSQTRISAQLKPAGQGVETAAAPIAADWLGQTSTLQSAAALQPAQVAAAPPVVAKADVSAAGGAQSGTRSQRGVRAVSTAAQGNSQANGQIAGQSMDSSSQMRDITSASVPTVLAGGTTASSAGSATSGSAHETFAALDGGTATASPTWTHAGTQYAEAGFHDPALGWVGVRADSASGAVHASLVPDSADSAQALGGHVAGLNTYLAEQHTPVETLTVAAPESRSLASAMNQSGMDQSGMNQSGSQGMHQGAGQDSGQGGYSEASSHARQSTPETTSSIESASTGRQGSSAAEIGLGDRHISVMA